MNQLATQGIVLRRTNYQEADRILTVLSKDQGKLSVIAKGARRAKSKLAGGIELFAVNDLTLINGKSNLHTLTSSRVKNHFSNIVKDIDRTMKAYDYLKLIDKVVDESADESEYFDVLERGLEGLNIETLDMHITDIWFYLHALNISGVVPNLRQDIDGNALEEGVGYSFAVPDMQFAKSGNGAFNSSHIKMLRVALRHDSAKNLSNITVEKDITTTCSDAVRNMVEHNLL